MIYQEITEMFEKCHSPLTIVDGELFYQEGNEIPEHCIVLAKEYKTRIIELLEGKDLTQQIKRDDLFLKVMYFYRNVLDESNHYIEEWLENNESAASIFYKLTIAYETAGWTDIKMAPFNYENTDSKKILEDLYQNAITHFKKGKIA